MLAHLATGRELSFDDHDDLTPPLGAHRRARGILPNGGRLIRSHEPSVRRLTGRYPRVVYMARDGRDVAVSYYHDFRRKGVLDRSFADFFDAFLVGRLDAWGTWSRHVQSWLDSPQASTGALIVVRYEDLLEDPEAELSRVAAFLGLPVDAGRVAETVALHTAARMREREQEWSRANAREVAPGVLFVRRATPGESQEVLSPQQQATFETLAGAANVRLGYSARPASPTTRADPGRSCRAH
jgi:hypothetical protein